MEHLESGGFSFSKYKPQYLECYKFRCSLFLNFWVPVKENVAKIYFLLSVLEEKVETLENNFGGISVNPGHPGLLYPKLPRENLPSWHSPPVS